MCCKEMPAAFEVEQNDCSCGCHAEHRYLSKKKRVEQMRNYLSALEEKAEDIREYIAEMEKAG